MEATNRDLEWAQAAVRALFRDAVEALYIELQVLVAPA
jgi:hypothetical protein